MNNIVKSALAVSAMCAGPFASAGVPAKDAAIEKAIERKLASMTLEEKVGQMTQLTLDAIGGPDGEGHFRLDPVKVRRALVEYKVGSILNTPSGREVLDPRQWYELISELNRVAISGTGIPVLYGLDQNHGTTYTLGGVLFPQNINMGASFNPALAEKAAAVTAYETRAGNCPWTFSPTVDLTRDPRWPRVWENFGEDPLLNAVMGERQVLGFQGADPNRVGADRVAACVKHYLGYGAPHSGQDRTPAVIAPNELREKFFMPYKACVDAGALSVMVNSASVNGMPVHANAELLTGWLKDELGWDGLIVTDWNDINNLYTRECVAADKKEAIAMAINAGIDMSMEPYDLDFCRLLVELVKEGTVPESRIDDAVARVLRLKYRLGLFDRPDTSPADYPAFGSEEHHLVALDAARESEVLLKNDGVLPLAKGVRILVAGPNADSMRALNGGWSYSWQGHIADDYAGKYNTIYEALAEKFGKDNVTLCEGVSYDEAGKYDDELPPEIDKAVAAAADVDVIVACVGENSYCETPGNLSDLRLSVNQRDLVKALAATGKPVVLVLNEGRPRIIDDIEPLVPAVIDVMLPGNMGADALAEILAGEVNPSGKLPFTYPKSPANLNTYDFRVSEQIGKMEGAYDYDAQVENQWPFGHGLSYTTFAYSEPRMSSSEFGPDDEICVSVDVTNNGNAAGKETVMLFSRDLVASVVPEARRLRAFGKVELAPGETKTVTLKIPASDLAFVGADGKWRLEKGDFRFFIGDKSIAARCHTGKTWSAPNK